MTTEVWAVQTRYCLLHDPYYQKICGARWLADEEVERLKERKCESCDICVLHYDVEMPVRVLVTDSSSDEEWIPPEEDT